MICEGLSQFWRRCSGLRDAGEVAFDVGHEHGHADAGEALGHGLQGDGFAGAGRAGDEPMAVGFVRAQETGGLAVLRNQDGIRHVTLKKYN